MAQATRATSGLPAPRSRTDTRAPRRVPPRLLRALSDERLVAILRRGHPEAFEALYDRYQAPLLSFCRHMLGSRCDGEDAVQQTFISAYRHLADSTRAIALRPWLYTIARNQCLSQLRGRREATGLDTTVDELPETAGLAEQVQRREDLRALLGDLAALPEQQRAALVLSELGDLSHRDVAAVLDCDPKQVKALVYQARSSLMADRKARELDCAQIREQLAVGRGHDLLRADLRRHIRSCDGCREFSAEVKNQRRAFSFLLPVVPTLALRHSTLSAALGSAGGVSVPAGSVVGAAAGKGLALKAIAVVVAGGAIGAGVAATQSGHHVSSVHRARPASTHAGANAAPVSSRRAVTHRGFTRHQHVGAAVAPPSHQPGAAAVTAVPIVPAHHLVAPSPTHSSAPVRHAYGHTKHSVPVRRHSAKRPHSPAVHKHGRVQHVSQHHPAPKVPRNPATGGKGGGRSSAAGTVPSN